VTWFLLRRLGLLVLALFVASVAIFALLRLLPGDLAARICGIEAPEGCVPRVRAELGLDRPLLTQYGEWMGGVVQGDLGRSTLTRTTVTSELGEKMTVTAPLVLASSVISLAAAVPLGIIAAVRSRRPDGLALSSVAQVGVAVPPFLIGLALIALMNGRFGLPSQGFPRRGWRDDFGRATRSLVLPTLTLAAAQSAVLIRFVRTSTLEVLNQDYIRTARAKGLTRTTALMRHGVRNAAIPVVSVLGIQIATLLAGVVVIEDVFSLPGVGRMLLDDIGDRDFDKVQGTVLLTAVIVLVVGFLVDIAHHLIDPRLRTHR
jgi:peptide/nickel transport system permease protein